MNPTPCYCLIIVLYSDISLYLFIVDTAGGLCVQLLTQWSSLTNS